MKKTAVLLLLLFVSFGFQPKAKVSNRCTTYPTQLIDTIKKNQQIEPTHTDTLIVGDLNNDAIIDTAFVYTPPTIKELDESGKLLFLFGCVDNKCYNKITFSCALPELYFEESVWGNLESIGDINHDGYAELLFSPNWFTSCWGQMYVYSLKGKQWNKITSVTYRRCEEEPLKSHVVKIKNRYYLKGIQLKDGDDKVYQVAIKL